MDDKWIKAMLEFDDDADNREFSDVELVGEKRALSEFEKEV